MRNMKGALGFRGAVFRCKGSIPLLEIISASIKINWLPKTLYDSEALSCSIFESKNAKIKET